MSRSNKHEQENVVSQVEENSKPKKQKTGRGIAVLALVLSLISLGVSASLMTNTATHMQKMLGLSSVPETITAEQQSSIQEKDSVERTVEQNVGIQEKVGLSDTSAMVQSDYGELEIELLNQRKAISNLDNSFNEIVKSRYQWILSETEYGLGIIALQLINTGNVEVAVRSLSSIQERLQTFDYPELIPLKRSIAEDIENLKSAQVVDMSDTLVKIDVLSSKVENLPLVVDSLLAAQMSVEKIKKEIDGRYYMRMWNDFISTIKNGVQIRSLNSPDPMLISPEQAFFIKENIKLLLQNARLSLLQRQQDSYSQFLRKVGGTIKEYFDLESKEIQDFLESVQELEKLNIVAPNIDLMKNSMSQVKALQSNEIVAPATSGNLEQPQLDSFQHVESGNDQSSHATQASESKEVNQADKSAQRDSQELQKQDQKQNTDEISDSSASLHELKKKSSEPTEEAE